MAIAMRANTFSGSDVLTFAGALLGVAIALWGTLHVEEMKAEKQRLRDLRRLSEAVKQVAGARFLIPQPLGPAGIPPEFALYQRYSQLKLAREMLVYATDRVIIDDMAKLSWISLLHNHLSDMIAAFQPNVERLFKGEFDAAAVDQWHKELDQNLPTLDMPLGMLMQPGNRQIV